MFASFVTGVYGAEARRLVLGKAGRRAGRIAGPIEASPVDHYATEFQKICQELYPNIPQSLRLTWASFIPSIQDAITLNTSILVAAFVFHYDHKDLPLSQEDFSRDILIKFLNPIFSKLKVDSNNFESINNICSTFLSYYTLISILPIFAP